jgi:DNA-directed RNA polymerase subunit beta
VRTIQELAGDEFRKGFLKLRRTAQERMNLENVDTVTPRNLINSKTFSSAIEYFFARGELSQVVDQTNPLSQLTHERRLSALGPGGLNRKRAGFEVRDVHISHYGRLCPIETPEGTNIGLISSSRSTLARRLRLPDHAVSRGEERQADRRGRAARRRGEQCDPRAGRHSRSTRRARWSSTGARVPCEGRFAERPRKDVQYMDVSTKQVVGVSASLIPFLEHDDANRALMGSNMQRQAVPLLLTEPPLVMTGMEEAVARNSGMVVNARKAARSPTSMRRIVKIGRRPSTSCASSRV